MEDKFKKRPIMQRTSRKLTTVLKTGMMAVALAAAAHGSPPTPAPRAPLKVGFVITRDANVIDLAGAWEVFQDSTFAADSATPAFELFTVSESTEPVTMTAGLRVIPSYSFENSPHPDIVVVGAQAGAPHLAEWLRARAADSQVVMSVCTGAFKLADAGLLDGKKATTHHDFYDSLAKKHPKIDVQRGVRFVQSDEVIYTSGGLTSGIDLALHIVEKFCGRDVANRTAKEMEYRRSEEAP